MYALALQPQQYKAVKDWVESYRLLKTREGIKLFSLALKEML